MNKKTILIAFGLQLVFLVSCSIKQGRFPTSENSENEDIVFNMDLIHLLSKVPIEFDKHPVQPPYIAKYSFGKKSLYYLATPHSRDISDATHRAIKRTLKKIRALNIVVEMNTEHKAQLQGQLEGCRVDTVCVEAPYAYKLAKAKGFDVFGGEPLDSVITKHFLHREFNINELIFFYTVRNFSQWHPLPPKPSYKPKNSKKEIENIIKHKKIMLEQIENPFNYNTLIKIYENGMNKEFDYKNVKYVDIAPYRDGHYIQKLSTVVDEARERNILETIVKAINIDEDDVFVIYGSGHYLKHRQVLKQVLGNPDIIKL